MGKYLTIALILCGTLACVFYPINPSVALLLGFALAACSLPGLSDGLVQRLSKLTFAWAIVGFGATVTLSSILALTTEFLLPTISGIALTLSGAWFLGRVLGIDAMLCALVGSGTAICGASAIASVGSALKAPSEKMSMALGVVLLFNAVALVVFPYLGHLLSLPAHQFAVWAGLAIHDTSSVVGAALAYDPSIVDEATTVKLARALWIAPITVLFTKLLVKDNQHASLKLPWFIWGYLIAATVAGFVHLSPEASAVIGDGSRRAFRVGLFLTGSAINVRLLKSLGFKPFLLGVIVWAVSACWSLLLITRA